MSDLMPGMKPPTDTSKTHEWSHYEPVGYYQRGPIEDRVADQLGTAKYVSEPRATTAVEPHAGSDS